MLFTKKKEAAEQNQSSLDGDILVSGKIVHRYHEDKYFALIILFFILFFLTIVSFI